MRSRETSIMRWASLLCGVCAAALATVAFADSDGSNAAAESFNAVILVGEHGLIERYDSSFTSRAQGRIPGACERMGVGAANLSWNNDALLIGVGVEGRIMEYCFEDMQVTRDAVVQLPKGPGFRDVWHIVKAILPLAHGQIYVCDQGYDLVPERQHFPTIHIDLDSGEGEVLDTFWLGPFSGIRVAPTGDRFVQFGRGVAVMVDGMTGHILHEVHLPRYRRSFLTQEPEAGNVYLLGYEFDWEQEVLDCWWVSMAPENVGELEHVLVSMKTGERVKQDSMSPWPELPEFDRFEFAETFLGMLLMKHRFVYRWDGVLGDRPLLRLVEAHTLARLSGQPALLENLPPEEPFRVFLTPKGRFLLSAYHMASDDAYSLSHYSRIVVLDTETGAIEADFVFENPLAGVFFVDE